MNISDVAKITGLTSKAIRFYEEKGLVTPPMRSENGYRTYTQQHLNELTLLRNQLLALANACPGDDSADCPIIENLSGCCHHRAG